MQSSKRKILPNVQDEPRPWLARLVLLGARDVTAMVVGSGALLGRLDCVENLIAGRDTFWRPERFDHLFRQVRSGLGIEDQWCEISIEGNRTKPENAGQRCPQ